MRRWVNPNVSLDEDDGDDDETDAEEETERALDSWPLLGLHASSLVPPCPEVGEFAGEEEEEEEEEGFNDEEREDICNMAMQLVVCTWPSACVPGTTGTA